MEILAQNISNVGELIDALSKIPRTTEITPFGDENTTLAYDKENNRIYMDNDTFLDEEFGIHENKE